jgi:hypothetical protein
MNYVDNWKIVSHVTDYLHWYSLSVLSIQLVQSLEFYNTKD